MLSSIIRRMGGCTPSGIGLTPNPEVCSRAYRAFDCSATSLTKGRRSIKGSGNLLPSSPPTEKATASEDETGKPSTCDRARDSCRRNREVAHLRRAVARTGNILYGAIAGTDALVQ